MDAAADAIAVLIRLARFVQSMAHSILGEKS
jgi:hypothetical protein